jgi:ClpP class serine protease
MGGVLIEGLGKNRNYYKDALDKLGIKANLIRVGQFKSAGEPFELNAPSQQALKAEAHVYDALWALYTGGVEKARSLPAGSIDHNMGKLPDALIEVKGNPAQLAIDWKWLDGLQTFESLRESLIKEVGKDEDIQSFRQVDWKDYLASEAKKVKGDHIAVVVAEGEISDGRAPAGKIGVNTGGYQTSWLAGAYDPRRALDPRMQSLVQSSIEHIYADFIGKVSDSRKLELAKVDDLAQGRIWTGAQASDHKLIDRLGSFSDAVEEARARVSKLDGASSSKELPIKYVVRKISFIEKFVQKFLGQLGWQAEETNAIPNWRVMSALSGPDALLLNHLGHDLAWLQMVIEKKQAFGAAAHCLCSVSP